MLGIQIGRMQWSSKGYVRHHNINEHKQCSWLDYKNNKHKNTSVLSQILDQHTRIVAKNRSYTKTIIVSLKMLAIYT